MNEPLIISYVSIKCNGVIQNLGTDVSQKHFMTKSVSALTALHPILPVYFNILSPGLGPYSNLEIIIIIFELDGWMFELFLNWRI